MKTLPQLSFVHTFQMARRHSTGPKEAAEKGPKYGENSLTNILQGLKPIDFIGFLGTTEIVP